MSDNNTRGKIIKTMYSLIAEKGYDKASIGQISELIGIKKASVYYYFKSKEEILLELVKEIYVNDYSDKKELFKNEIDVNSYKNELILMGEEFIDSYFENKDLRKVYAEIDIQMTRIPALQAFIETGDEKFNQFLIECITYGVAIGAFPKDFDINLNAQILYTILVGIDQAILYDFNLAPKAIWKEIILKMFERKVL